MRIPILLARAVVLERIGRDEHHFRLHRAPDRIVVSGQFDRRVLIHPDRGDVARLYLRFDVQFLVHRDDLQNLFSGPHHTPDCGNRQLVHHPAHRGHQNRARQLILRQFQLLPQHCQVRFGFRAVIGAFQSCRLNRLVQLIFGIAGGLARPRDFDQWCDLFLIHLFQQVQFLGRLLQHCPCPIDPRCIFVLSGFQQAAFRVHDIRHPRRDIIGNRKVSVAFDLGLQPQSANFQRCNLIRKLIHRRLILGAIKPRQSLTGLHYIAFTHIQFGQNPAFQILDDLGPRRRHHLTRRMHDLVHPGNRRPKHKSGN